MLLSNHLIIWNQIANILTECDVDVCMILMEIRFVPDQMVGSLSYATILCMVRRKLPPFPANRVNDSIIHPFSVVKPWQRLESLLPMTMDI